MHLARHNQAHNQHHLPASQTLTFSKGDIFSPAWLQHHQQQQQKQPCDILVCNPPYISPWGFAHQTARSVRKFEPKLAQVPAVAYAGDLRGVRSEDVFYARLLDVGAALGPRVMLFEVGDLAQALRVVEMAWAHTGLGQRAVEVEVWRDWPDAAPREDEDIVRVVEVGERSREVRIKGSGHGRSVFIQCS